MVQPYLESFLYLFINRMNLFIINNFPYHFEILESVIEKI